MSKLLTRILNTFLFVTMASVLILGATVVPVHAGSTKTFIAQLNSGQQVPPTGSNAFGVAHLLFDEFYLAFRRVPLDVCGDSVGDRI